MMSYSAATALLARSGIPLPSQRLVHTAEEAMSAAEDIGGAVALKLIAADHTHKSDQGLVRLHLRGSAEVGGAADELLGTLPDGEGIEGLLVQSMVTGGCEALLGALVDPQFGPLIALGPGGTAVETVDKVDFLRPPFDRLQGELFIERNALAPFLAGGRGKQPFDTDALTGALLALASLIVDHRGEIRSIDINPLAVLEGSRGVMALDYRIEEDSPCR
jgi:succinyl-CoA synthetase beta subunit